MNHESMEREMSMSELINPIINLYTSHWLSKVEKPVDFNLLYKNDDYLLRDSMLRFGTAPMVDQDIIQVKYRPIKAYSYMGWREFKSPIDYMIYMLLLAFLQEKDSTDQFLLSEVVEKISEDNKLIDLKKSAYRISLTNALKKLIHLRLIEIEDGNMESFLKKYQGEIEFFEEYRADVLYNVTDLLLTVGPIIPDKYESYESFNEWKEDNPRTTLTLRQQAYTRLLTEPAIFRNSEDIECFKFIRDNEKEIQEFFQGTSDSEITHYELEIMNDYAALISTKKGGRFTYPAQNSPLDEVLMELAYQVWANDYTDKVISNGSIVLSEHEFKLLVDQTISENAKYWYSNMRQESPNKLRERLIKRGEMMALIEVCNKEVILLPTLGRLLGIVDDN